MQRYENRAGISLAMYNDQSTWLEKKADVGSLLGTARAAERAARRETEKHFVAFCFPTDHKPRGDRARKDYGTV